MPICKPEDFLFLTNNHKNLLGFDHGTKNIGIAICNKVLSVATPLKTLVRQTQELDFSNLYKIIKENDAGGIVVGLPLNMDGSKGPRCQSVETFFTSFLKRYDFPLLYQDERMSTQAIEKIFIKQDLSRKKRAVNIDKHAACWILQSALDILNKK